MIRLDPMTQLNQAVVLVTGAAGGFGQELTRQLLEAGSRLILTDLHEAALHEQVANIQRSVTTGEVLACLEVDLSDRAGCERLYQQVRSLGFPVDILINNAGIGVFGRSDEVPADKWERLMQINLLAPMRLSALFVADMIARRQGHIVNISSLAGWSGAAGMSYYAASKFGLRGFSESLYNDTKEHNVKVTAVYPFFSRTPILDSERFGSLAKNFELPASIVTNPADVMRETLQGIVNNQLHIFPDRTAKILHRLKRYSPQLLDWIYDRFARSAVSGQRQP